MELVQILKAIADENRLRILKLLDQEELCVCEIETILEIGQSNVSRHLYKLFIAHLICREKKSQWVYYRLDKETMEKYPFLTNIFNGQSNRMDIFKKDQERFNQYKKNGMSCERLHSKKSLISTKTS